MGARELRRVDGFAQDRRLERHRQHEDAEPGQVPKGKPDVGRLEWKARGQRRVRRDLVVEGDLEGIVRRHIGRQRQCAVRDRRRVRRVAKDCRVADPTRGQATRMASPAGSSPILATTWT